MIPPTLPTAPQRLDRKVVVATALLQASAYGDRAEVGWLRECSDHTEGFDYFSDSGVTGSVA